MFAFQPMYPTAAGNYGDDLSRYQASVSLAAYYQSGGADPALSAAGGTPRDMYTAGGVGGDKFGRGGSEVSVTMSQSSVGQATQGEWACVYCAAPSFTHDSGALCSMITEVIGTTVVQEWLAVEGCSLPS